jgi:hypothetical protein
LTALQQFKDDYDKNQPLWRILPEFAVANPQYERTGLRDLCQQIHTMYQSHDVARLTTEMYLSDMQPAMKPSDAFAKMAHREIDRVAIDELEGRVTAVHGISIACQPKEYRHELYKLCLDAGLSFVACPGAWLDARRNETLTPTHNAVTPIDEMIPAGLCVALGSDNIADIYKPFADGDMMTELRMLLESTHFYDTRELIRVATENGRRVLGLD